MMPRAGSRFRAAGHEVKLRLKAQKIGQLIRSGQLCATDFACLDCRSRDTLKRLFLQCSLSD